MQLLHASSPYVSDFPAFSKVSFEATYKELTEQDLLLDLAAVTYSVKQMSKVSPGHSVARCDPSSQSWSDPAIEVHWRQDREETKGGDRHRDRRHNLVNTCIAADKLTVTSVNLPGLLGCLLNNV